MRDTDGECRIERRDRQRDEQRDDQERELGLAPGAVEHAGDVGPPLREDAAYEPPHNAMDKYRDDRR